MTELEDKVDEIINHLRDEGFTEEEIYIIGQGISDESGLGFEYEIVEETLETWEPEGEAN